MAGWAKATNKVLGFVKRGNHSLLDTVHHQFIQTIAGELLNRRHENALFSCFETDYYNGFIIVNSDSACFEEVVKHRPRRTTRT